MVSEQEMQHEINALREAYAKATREPYYGEDREMNEPMYGADSGMTSGLTAKSPDMARDARGEIERLVMQLAESVNRIDETSQKIIEKTHSVAAMDRSIPSDGDDVAGRIPETQLGNALYDCITRIDLINNRLNEHTYKLEL